MIPARQWNALLASRRRNRVLSITLLARGTWKHPWFTTLAWNAEAEEWRATVKPGFVNGADVIVEEGVSLPDGSLTRSATPLTNFPAIPLTSFRAIGGSANIDLGAAGEPVPEFFAALGVRSAQLVTEESLEAGTPTDITAAKLSASLSLPVSSSSPERLLRACDIILRCHRPRTAVDWIFGSSVENTNAQFVVGSASSHLPSSIFHLHVSASFSPIQSPDDLTKLAGSYNDPGYDETKVCTVYLLSPPDTAIDAEIDGTWTPYVRHELFWNADYHVTAPGAGTPAQNLAVNLAGLGNVAGAQINVNQLLATNNDAFAAALQFLTAREITGTITTPGHRVPPIWDKTQSLDPPFPFKGLANIKDHATSGA